MNWDQTLIDRIIEPQLNYQLIICGETPEGYQLCLEDVFVLKQSNLKTITLNFEIPGINPFDKLSRISFIEFSFRHKGILYYAFTELIHHEMKHNLCTITLKAPDQLQEYQNRKFTRTALDEHVPVRCRVVGARGNIASHGGFFTSQLIDVSGNGISFISPVRLFYQLFLQANISNKKIMVIGPDMNAMGGMSSVIKVINDFPPENITYVNVFSFIDCHKFIKILIFIKAIILVLKHLLLNNVDIAHIHFTARGSIIRKILFTLLLISFRKPYILHAHGGDFHIYSKRIPLVIKKIIKWCFQKSSGFIVLSEKWKSYYISDYQLNPDQVKVLINPVIIPRQYSTFTNREIVRFVFLGNIIETKGAFDLIHAVSALPNNIKQRIQVTMAGKGALEKARKLVDDYHLHEQFNIYSWLNHTERDSMLLSSDVFILPSYHEGVPMALLEAMAFGLPVITTPVGGIPEVISHGEHGLMVAPGNLQELSAAIATMANNYPLRLKFGRRNFKTVQSLSIDRYGMKLRDIYFTISD